MIIAMMNRRMMMELLIIGNKEGNRTRNNIDYKNIDNYNNNTCNDDDNNSC